MDKQIPIYFDTIILNSPAQEVSMNGGPDIGTGSRLKVAVFSKYANRNGSYITDEYAQHLIESATHGDTPIVGFFDPESQNWASHTGPTLANAYGYVEDFIGWEPLTDTDGVTRDYAVFSIVIFSKYYEEARKIQGQNQSMELDINTIKGDWADFDGVEYFVYTQGDMLGLCIIGTHEPCFSVSHFFSKEDNSYKTQYEKFAVLLSELKEKVKQAENNTTGGEHPMENFENQEITEETEVVEPVAADSPAEETPEKIVTNFEENGDSDVTVDTSITVDASVINLDTSIVAEETPAIKFEEEPAAPVEDNRVAELEQQLFAANERITELESLQQKIEELQTQNEQLQSTVTTYEAKINEYELARKNELIEKYEKVLTTEEIAPIREGVKDFSYDELEGKLAIMFAKQRLTDNDVPAEKVPLPEQPESQFALLMKKYRKK